MELRDLRYFLLCAELGSLQLAAQRVARTQPALTKSIRRLEAELDTRLFEKDGRSLRLTAMGQTLEIHARKLVRSVGEAKREVTEVAEGQVGHVRIGTGPTMAEWFLPLALENVQRQTPNLTFQVRVELDEALRRDLNEGFLDFIIGPIREGDKKEYKVSDLGDDTLVVVSRLGHPLSGREASCLDLSHYRWMLPTATSLRWIQAAFARHAIAPPEVQMEVSSVVVLRRVVARSDLLTFMSRRDIAGSRDANLQEIHVPELMLKRRFGLLTPRDGHVPIAARRVATLIASEASNFLEGTG